MKLSPKERAAAIALFSSSSVQAVADFGQWNIAGEPGTIAHRCGDAAKVFVAVGTQLKADGQMAAVALSAFCSSAGSFLIDGNPEAYAVKAFNRAKLMLDYIEVDDGKVVEPKAETPEADTAKAEEQKPEGEKSEDNKQVEGNKVVDVATEDLELPAKTRELLLSLSTAEIDLTTASKIRAQDNKQSIESLKDIGPQIRKKILEAVDKAIGPEVTA